MNKYLDTLEPTDIRELYQYDDGPEIILEHVRHVRDSFRGDATTEAGRKAIKSMARKVASFKNRCDDERKAMVGKWKSQIKVIDQRGKYLRDELDAIRDEIREPVTQFENREKERVETLQARLNVFLIAQDNAMEMTPAEITGYAATLEAIDTLNDDWQEFGQKAREAKSIALTKLRQLKEWKDANVAPSGPVHSVDDPRAKLAEGSLEPGVADIAEVIDTDWPSKRAEIREDIMQAIVCKSAEQIVDAIMAGEVPHVRVEV